MTGYRRVGVYMWLVTGMWGYICDWLPACGGIYVAGYRRVGGIYVTGYRRVGVYMWLVTGVWGYICDWLPACEGIYVTGYRRVGVYM